MKIYVPQNNEIRERVAKEISGHEDFDYTCNQNEYEFLKEISEEEYLSLGVNSKEHMIGNVLVYENNEIFILDGLGYFRVAFKPTN